LLRVLTKMTSNKLDFLVLMYFIKFSTQLMESPMCKWPSTNSPLRPWLHVKLSLWKYTKKRVHVMVIILYENIVSVEIMDFGLNWNTFSTPTVDKTTIEFILHAVHDIVKIDRKLFNQ
jgi:hypothetical protein